MKKYSLFLYSLLLTVNLSAQAFCNYHAVIFAADDYRYKGFDDLSKPIIYGEDLKNVLNARYDFESVRLVLNPTRQDFIDTLAQLTQEMDAKDALLIVYSGHGIDQRRENYFIPVDGKKNTPDTWLAISTVRQYIQKIKTRHVLLVTDAC